MWLLEESALSELRTIKASGARFGEPEAAAMARRNAGPPAGYHVDRGGVAVVGVNGVLTRDPDWMLHAFGVPNTSYAEIHSALSMAAEDPAVRSIRMEINSPGGEVSGLFDVLNHMSVHPKPIDAIADRASSAAYAIGATARTLKATSEASMFGSIGVVANATVDPSRIAITSTEAPDKRPDVTTEQGRGVIRAQLDQVHELFAKAIASGRGISVDAVNSDYGRGREFLANEARARGMIDGIEASNFGAEIPGTIAAKAEGKGSPMDLETLKREHPETYRAAVAHGADNERDRVLSHLKMGEASGDLKTAFEAIRDGSGMTQTLTATYLAAGLSRRDQSERQVDDAAAGSALAAAAPPAEHANPATAGDDAFAEAFANELKALRGMEIS